MPIQGTESLGGKTSQEEAGYMELSGAVKDSTCAIVEGKVSSRLGCCNLFRPEDNADEFRCGECDWLR